MSKVAILYWSTTGNTQELAEEIEAGAKSAGAETDLEMIDDFDLDQLDSFTAFALGCPAMGDEQLDASFQFYYNQLKPSLSGKICALFGSYGWGGGKYMDAWKADAEQAGLKIYGEPLTCVKKPDEAARKKAQELGKALANI